MKLRELQKLSSGITNTSDTQAHIYNRLLSLGLDPNNFYQELEMSSPLVDTHRDISYSNAFLHLHSHDFFELLYCCNSCDAEYLVGADRYRLQQGDIVFIPPGVSHRPLLPEQLVSPYKRYVLWLSTEFMHQYASLFPYPFGKHHTQSSMLRTGGTQWEHLGELFRKGVLESEQQADGWEAAIIGNTITLLTHIKRATNDRSARTLRAEKPELLDQIMGFIEANYHTCITIGDLAKAFFVSSSTISHLFKQKMGVSFYRYVTQRRLIAAKSLILEGVPLEAVSSQIGFSDYSSFYRAFKQEYGISPRQFRKMR